MVGFCAPTLFGPDTPRFLFLGVCEANKSSTAFVFTTFKTRNSESRKLLHLSLQMFLVQCGRKWNTLRCLQSHQWSPHTYNFDKHTRNKNYLRCFLIWVMFNICTLFRLIRIAFWNHTMTFGTHCICILCTLEMWYSIIFVRISPDVITFQLFTPKVVGV
jgi:hypothetical protein